MPDTVPAGEKKKCRHPFLQTQCPFEAEEGSVLCIFHLPADRKAPAEFWRHLASYLVALLDKAGNEATKAWREGNPNHWVFREADPALIVAYATVIPSEVEESPDRAWSFFGFVFPPMDSTHNFLGFIFPAASFGFATFSGEADFGRATFSGAADFRRAKFSGAADFGFATFSGAADFWFAKFSGAADFWFATFSGAADFGFATFGGEAYFGGATFSGAAIFSHATFGGAANFWFATFGGAADFGFATFSGPVYLNRANVKGLVDFTRVSLRNRLLFEGTVLDSQARVLLWSLDFVHGTSDIEIEKGHRRGRIVEPAGQVVFRDISQGMNRVSFLHTDILTDRLLVRFSNVKWEANPREFIFDAKFTFIRRREWSAATLRGKTGLPEGKINQISTLFSADLLPVPQGEQELKREAEQLAGCETLVRQDVERIAREIRRSTEKYGSYPDAGDFHVAEMEYRRVQAHGFFKFALWLYKVTSNYGESPSLALRRLGELWFASANLYFWFGFDHESKVLWEAWADLPPLAVLSRAGWALLSGIVNMVPGYFRFQRETLACGHVAVLMAVQALVGVGVLALFLLAIRRRFRR